MSCAAGSGSSSAGAAVRPPASAPLPAPASTSSAFAPPWFHQPAKGRRLKEPRSGGSGGLKRGTSASLADAAHKESQQREVTKSVGGRVVIRLGGMDPAISAGTFVENADESQVRLREILLAG